MSKQDWLKENGSKVVVPDLATGKEWLAEVTQEMQEVFVQMKSAEDNKHWRELNDLHYDLRNVKRDIQSQMGSFVKAEFMKKKGGSSAI